MIYNWRFSPENTDRTYGVGYTISAVEANLAVATGCVPSLGPLMRRIMPKLFGSTADQNNSRPVLSSGYQQQQSGVRENVYAMKSFSSQMEQQITGWKGKGRAEAWSSEDNILASEGVQGVEIRKDVKVDVTFVDARDVETASHDGRASDKRSF